MTRLISISTVHSRGDTRIFVKQVQTLQAAFPGEVTLVVADGKGDEIHPDGTPILDLGRAGGGRFGRAVLGSARAFRLLRRLRPGIVHFHDPELIPLGFALKALGCRVIYDVHEDLPRQVTGKPWIPRLLRGAVAGVMQAVEWAAGLAFDAIIPATPSIAARFPASKRVLVQNYPLAAELFLEHPSPYAGRPAHFAYVGGLTASRGALEMVRAVGLLADVPGLRLDFAGSISPARLTQELAITQGWSSVNCLGVLDRSHVAALLGAVRGGLVLFLPLPNHVNAQPNKLFEYMAAGLPVIASDFPLWRTIVGDAQCGLLVDPEHPEAIAAAMRWLLEHPDEAEAMGRRGRAAVVDVYNWDHEGERLTALYTSLLSTK